MSGSSQQASQERKQVLSQAQRPQAQRIPNSGVLQSLPSPQVDQPQLPPLPPALQAAANQIVAYQGLSTQSSGSTSGMGLPGHGAFSTQQNPLVPSPSATASQALPQTSSLGGHFQSVLLSQFRTPENSIPTGQGQERRNSVSSTASTVPSSSDFPTALVDDHINDNSNDAIDYLFTLSQMSRDFINRDPRVFGEITRRDFAAPANPSRKGLKALDNRRDAKLQEVTKIINNAADLLESAHPFLLEVAEFNYSVSRYKRLLSNFSTRQIRNKKRRRKEAKDERVKKRAKRQAEEQAEEQARDKDADKAEN